MDKRLPAEAFPPGEWVRDALEARGWSQTDLAEVLDRPVQLVNELIAGKKSITPETAKGLAQALNTSPQYWLNLDAAYQLFVSRDPDPAIGWRARIYSKAPVREMVRRGWIEHSRNPAILQRNVLAFLGISDLDDSPNVLPAAARMSTAYDAFHPSQWAWLCRARQLGAALSVAGRFTPESSELLVARLQALLGSVEDTRHVPRVLSEAGIRFVVVEHLSKSRIDGACLWLDKRSPIIALSLRYDRIDYFWFTIMHELKHALKSDGLQRGVPTLDIDLVGEARVKKEDKPEFERAADDFAENALISQPVLDDFILRKRPLFSESSIRNFGMLHHVHPGIVVGQLQHRHEIGYSTLRRLLVKVRDVVTESALTDGWGRTVESAV